MDKEGIFIDETERDIIIAEFDLCSDLKKIILRNASQSLC